MKIIWSLILLAAMPPALAALTAPAARAEEKEQEEIVVKASLARAEIQRILRADDLDTVNISPLDVASAMARIRRGRAPADFWNSYQAHVRAWERFAEAAGDARSDQREAIAAERAINSTFDEVERIARRYGARMPKPGAGSNPASKGL